MLNIMKRILFLVLICAFGSVYATTYPGPPNDAPELIDKGDWIDKYLTDLEYRKRHDSFANGVWGEIDPERKRVRRFAITKINVDTLLRNEDFMQPNGVSGVDGSAEQP